MFGAVKSERANCIGIKTLKSWLFPKVEPFSFKTPITLNLAPRIDIILSIGLTSLSNPFSKSEPTIHTYALLSMSNLVKLRPELVSNPELVMKNSSTPTTVFSGSVLDDSYFTSATEVAVKESEVSVKGYLYLFLKFNC